MRKKILSAGLTLAVMALIRTDASPVMWQVGLVTLMFYFVNLAVIDAAIEEVKRSRRRKIKQIELQSIRRWAKEDFGGRYIEIIS
jgi:hypothetical protein